MTAYTFLLPNFVGFLLFTLIPIVCSMGLSVMEWDSANPMKFVGLENFARLFKDETFYYFPEKYNILFCIYSAAYYGSSSWTGYDS